MVETSLPFEGLRVVELGSGLIGPFCGMQLATFGARVVKVETAEGDWLREVDDGGLYTALNRDKDIHRWDPTAANPGEELDKLLTACDVVLLERPGNEFASLSYDEWSATNAGVIWAEYRPYEADGQRSELSASELAIQMAAGVNRHMGVTGGAVIRSGFDIASLSTALFLFNGIAAGLRERADSGKGQRVDVSMLAAMTAMLEWNLVSEFHPDEWIGVQLDAYDAKPEYAFVVTDGVAHVDFRGDVAGWDRFIVAADRPELTVDPRFANPKDLIRNIRALKRELASATRDWTFEQLDRVVREAGGSIVPVSSGAEAVNVARQRHFFDGRAGDTIDLLARPWTFSGFSLPDRGNTALSL